MLSRTIPAYSASSAPLAGTSRFRRFAAYTPCPRGASPPHRPVTGSLLSLSALCRHVVLRDSGKFVGCFRPVPSPTTLAFAQVPQARHSRDSPPSASRGAGDFGAEPRFAFATTCRLACPSVGSDPAFAQPTGTLTSGLPTDRSPSPPPDITTVATEQAPPAGLPPARTSASIAARHLEPFLAGVYKI